MRNREIGNHEQQIANPPQGAPATPGCKQRNNNVELFFNRDTPQPVDRPDQPSVPDNVPVAREKGEREISTSAVCAHTRYKMIQQCETEERCKIQRPDAQNP